MSESKNPGHNRLQRILVLPVAMFALGTLLFAVASLSNTNYLMVIGAALIGSALAILGTAYRFHKQIESMQRATMGLLEEGEEEDELSIPAVMLQDLDAVAERLRLNVQRMEQERSEARQIARELHQFTDVVRRSAASEDISGIVDSVLEVINESYDAAGIELWLMSSWYSTLTEADAGRVVETPLGEEVRLSKTIGWDAANNSIEFSRGAPVLGCIDNCSRLIATDKESIHWLFEKSWIKRLEVRSFAAYPLIVRGEPIGALALFSRQQLTDIFLGMVECYAQLIALSIADQRSLLESRQTASKLEAANIRQQEINKQLAEADRLKSEFLTTISHELRTPLNGILGFLGLLKDGLADGPDEEHEFIRSAYVSADHLLTLINDVLNLSEIDSGKAKLDLQSVDAGDLVRSVASDFLAPARSKGLELVLEIPEEPNVLADPRRLEQVLSNLLDNAVKFTHEGSVTVRVGVRGAFCGIQVIDTGVGIPPEMQERLFEKFYQIDGSTTRQYGGTGLGLALARGLVAMMGGQIHIESDGQDLGTTVDISLPLAPSELLGASESGDPDGPAVLVVEDDMSLGRYLCLLLRKAGYSAKLASTLEQAREELESATVAAISLDWALGNGTTVETAGDFIRYILNLGSPPGVMLVTGHDAAARQFLADENKAEVIPVMVKPVDPTQYLDAMRSLTSTSSNRKAA